MKKWANEQRCSSTHLLIYTGIEKLGILYSILAHLVWSYSREERQHGTKILQHQ